MKLEVRDSNFNEFVVDAEYIGEVQGFHLYLHNKAGYRPFIKDVCIDCGAWSISEEMTGASVVEGINKEYLIKRVKRLLEIKKPQAQMNFMRITKDLGIVNHSIAISRNGGQTDERVH